MVYSHSMIGSPFWRPDWRSKTSPRWLMHLCLCQNAKKGRYFCNVNLMDDLLLDSKGLPSSTQKAIHGIVYSREGDVWWWHCCFWTTSTVHYSKEESPAFGGGIVVSGQLPQFIMSLCETGIQASRECRGLPTNRDANLHEWALVSFYPVITPITAVITHILRFWAGITKTTVTR